MAKRSSRAPEIPSDIERIFKGIYERSSQPGGILDLAGKVLIANQAACDLIGIDPSLVLGRLVWETPWWAHSTEEQEKLRDGVRRASRGESVHFQTTHLMADGKLRYVEFDLKPVRGESGYPFCIITEGRDVTEAKRAEEELAAAESMMRSVFRATPVGITFNKNRVIIDANDSMYDLMRYTREQMIGHSARMFYDSEEEFERVGRELYGDLPAKGRTSVQTRFRRGDGATIFVVLSAALLRAEDPGAGHVVAVQDITERKLAEDALRESEARFRHVVEDSPFSIQIVAQDGRVLAVNDACQRMWGVTLDAMAGYNMLHDAELERLSLMPLVRRAFGGELVQTPVVEYDASRSLGTGRRRFVQGTLYPLRGARGELHQVIVVHIDLTDRMNAEKERNKLQEQLQQAMKMEAVGRLAGGIAHDFNNLLTAITGNAQLARMDPAATGLLARHLDEISRAAESAASLTSQLLAFSRQKIIEPRVLVLNDLVERMKTMLARLLGEDVELETRLAPDLGSVKVDPGQFEQVLANLAVNARDAMPDGGRLLVETANRELDADTCARHPEMLPGHAVLLTVSDTGIGMTEEVKKRIFEPFFTTKPKGKGTGLGLATIFGIVKQAGGSIDIYSEPNMGTTFKIHLPRVELPPEPLDAPKPAAEILHGTETILLVEDNESVLALALSILRSLGYDVLHAHGPTEALRLAGERSARIDLLLTDVIMPAMNGRELAERLLTVHPEMKVLYTSGYTEDVILHQGVLDKGLHFIGKPYSLRGLSQKVREILDAAPGS